MKAKRIISAVVIAAIFILCIWGTYRVLCWKDTVKKYTSSVTQMYETGRNLTDVVFVGSSHCYFSVYPQYFWEDMGVSVFDLAVSSQDYKSAYYQLKELLKTQNPKVVFMDVYGITYDEQQVAGNEYRNLLSMNTSINSVEHVLMDSSKEKWLDYIFRFPIIHTRYKELGKFDFVDYKPNSFIRGETLTWRKNGQGEPLFADGELNPVPLDKDQLKWLDDMVKLSEKEKFSLVFYTSPYFTTQEEQAQTDAVSVYAEEHGIPMFDLNRLRREIGFDFHEDLIDSGHCNAYGARKIADFFENYLSENFDLTDHRGDERYWQWDMDLKWYDHCRILEGMEDAADMPSYTALASELSDTVTVISLEGNEYADGEYPDYVTALSEFGIDVMAEGAGKWIYRDGRAEKVLDNDVNAKEYYLELNNTDTLRLKYEGDYLFKENIMINRDSYYNKYCRLAVIVYDCMSGEVVSYRCF